MGDNIIMGLQGVGVVWYSYTSKNLCDEHKLCASRSALLGTE